MNPSSPWLTVLRAESIHTRLLLICAPYAGGSASVFRAWVDRLPASIAIYGIELPGRGSRFSESAIEDMDLLVDQLTVAVRPQVNRPYALFGHSLGAVVMYELARKLENERAPQRLILSGQRAFHRPSPRPPIHDLPDSDFIHEIQRYGGTPTEVWDDPELRDVFLPILRADFTLGETYRHTRGERLATSITAYGGLKDDEVTISDVRAWREYTNAEFSYRMFPGDHFFLIQDERLVTESIVKDLLA